MHLITGLTDYMPVALTSVVMESFEKLASVHLKDITGPLLDPQIGQWMMQSTAVYGPNPPLYTVKTETGVN